MVSRTTVVTATRDRADDLAPTLARPRELDVPVVVVDNGSSDDTVARVRRGFDEVDLPALGHNEGALARNRGVRHATTRTSRSATTTRGGRPTPCRVPRTCSRDTRAGLDRGSHDRGARWRAGPGVRRDGPVGAGR
ncbi:glycosyltransferase [Actinosynnema sp. NPDC023794]